MSYGNGFRLVWLNKGGSMLEPIKDRWWRSNCSLLGERRGSILCTLITPHFYSYTTFKSMHKELLIIRILLIILFRYFFCWTLHWHKTNANKSRSAWHCFAFLASCLNRSLLLIIMHMQQQLIWIKTRVHQTRLQPILDRILPWDVFSCVEVKWIINQ